MQGCYQGGSVGFDPPPESLGKNSEIKRIIIIFSFYIQKELLLFLFLIQRTRLISNSCKIMNISIFFFLSIFMEASLRISGWYTENINYIWIFLNSLPISQNIFQNLKWFSAIAQYLNLDSTFNIFINKLIVFDDK